MNCTPKVKQKTFGVQFIFDTPPCWLYRTERIGKLSIFIPVLSIFFLVGSALLCIVLKIIFHETDNNLFIFDLFGLGYGWTAVRLRLGGGRRSQDLL